MGSLTTITIYNDALDTFKEHPLEFAKALFDGIDEANRDHSEATVGFMGYCNYITVQHSRHADDHALYLHAGNMVLSVGEYEDKFCEWAKRDPKAALNFLKNADWILKGAKKFAKGKLQAKTEKK